MKEEEEEKMKIDSQGGRYISSLWVMSFTQEYCVMCPYPSVSPTPITKCLLSFWGGIWSFEKKQE